MLRSTRPFVLAAALAGVGACSSQDTADPEAVTGRIDLSLAGRSSSGAIYRLRDAQLTISPTGQVFRTEDNPDRSVISTRLDAGLYTLSISAGWRLERVGGGTAETVFAVLTSQDPQPFDVLPGATTPVRLAFRADGQDVTTGQGDVDISVDVDDTVLIDAGVPDAGTPDAATVPDAGTPDAVTVPDAAPLAIQIMDGPPPMTNNPRPSFSFATSAPGTVECFINGLAFFQCTSPFVAPPLPDGDHVFSVRVFAADGRSATASRAFTLDATPPTITIDQQTGPTQGTRRLVFSTNEPATLECTFDDVAIVPCLSPYITPVLYPLSMHTFVVRATDALSNTRRTERTITAPFP